MAYDFEGASVSFAYSASFNDHDVTLYISSKRGLRRVIARPLKAEVFAIDDHPPGWKEQLPRVHFKRLFRQIAAAKRLRPTDRSREEAWFDPPTESPPRTDTEILQTAAALKKFFAHAGRELCREVSHLPCELHFWSLYCLHRIGPSLEKLLRWNPSLFAAVLQQARIQQDRYQALEWIYATCKQPRAMVARSLGYPSSNFLRRISPQSLTSRRLGLLKRICASGGKSSARRTLSHLPMAGASTIELLARDDLFPRHVSQSFLQDLATSGRDREFPHVADRVSAFFQFLRSCGVAHLPKLHSVERFDDLYEEFIQQMDSYGDPKASRFPPPPFEEPGYIEGIRDPLRLAGEAMEMHNCVSTFAGDIARGRCYVYRVLNRWGMTRATMLVRRDPEAPSRWRLVEANARNNKSISKRCYQSLIQWLCEQQNLKEESHVVPTRGEF